MTEEARAARNAYRREWYKKNPEKRRLYEERYWCKKGLSDTKKSEENGKEGEMK